MAKIKLALSFFALATMWCAASAGLASPVYLKQNAFIDALSQGQFGLQIGGFGVSSQGQAQQINIVNLIGDYYSVNNQQNKNALIGASYLLPGPQFDRVNFLYGISAFYFLDTSVSGVITQEGMFDNLAYSYNVNNIPVYAAIKALIPLQNNRFHISMDFGVGPNIMTTNSYNETSLDGGVTIPDNAFTGRTTTNFSVTAGLGIKVDHVIDQVPLECGYRFFYLGQGSFNTINNQIENTLTMQKSYAQGILCGITF